MKIYLLIIVLLFVCELIYFQIADKYNIIDKPNLRSSHSNITIRGSGIIFLIAVWIHTAFYGFFIPIFLVGLTLIAGISFVDDIHSVPNKFRLIVQFAAMFLMFYELNILNVDSWWMVIIGLILCVGIINAYNFMDGINGITGGYSLAVLVPLLLIQGQNQSDTSLVITTILSDLVFCFFNFRPKKRLSVFPVT